MIDFENLLKNLNEEIWKCFLDERLINVVALTVIAGYHWAKDRHFDNFFNEAKFIEDREYAKNKLKETYKSKKIKDVIKAMIDKQAEVIWLRRKYDGIKDPPDSYNRDNWEARRFIAYLFMDKIIEDCVERNICPDIKLNLFDTNIVGLLKSLTIEEYCRIKAYLIFLEKTQSEPDKAYWNDDENYRKAMSYLDRAFNNCKCREKTKIHKDNYNLLFSKINTKKIKEAKKNPSNRIGLIDEDDINKFVDEYYSFLEVISENSQGKIKDDTVESIIKKLYDVSYTKIINMLEFMLKCMIVSYTEESTHEKERENVDKPPKGKPITRSDPIYV